MINALQLQADANRIPLEDKSVHMVVTSPPYWGLRDYGTAIWEGGDEDCEHNPQRVDGGLRKDRALPKGRKKVYRSICHKCGAVRLDDQIGLEEEHEAYIAKLLKVFDEVWRVLRDDGTLWLNLGDSYSGSGGAGGDYGPGGRREGQPKYPGRKGTGLKKKDLAGIPWRVALALQARGWYLRRDIIWHKLNPLPESPKDRPTNSHEYIFLLTKQPHYFYDWFAVLEPLARVWGKNNMGPQNIWNRGDAEGKVLGRKTQPHSGLSKAKPNISGRLQRDVWSLSTRRWKGAHFAVFNPDLVEKCIQAGSSAHGVCGVCGAPWERKVERIFHGEYNYKEAYKQRERMEGIRGGGVDKVTLGRTEHTEYKELGWEPTCAHQDAPIVPAIVFDPFGGSGTTAMVSRNLGRLGLCLDLSLEYCQLARERLGQKALDEWTNGKPGEGQPLGDLPLYQNS